jgi:Flp pilus assembly pilin Flp
VLGGTAVAKETPVLNFVGVLGALELQCGKGVRIGRKNSVDKFLRCEKGLELSEYAVAAALVTALTVIAFAALGNVIVDRINTLASYIP